LPTLVGKYVICIKFGDAEIAKSPFRVQVDKAATLSLDRKWQQ